MRIMLPCGAEAQKRHPSFSALCVSVTGRCVFNAAEEGTVKILRTFCPEGWNFHKCSVLAKTCFQ